MRCALEVRKCGDFYVNGHFASGRCVIFSHLGGGLCLVLELLSAMVWPTDFRGFFRREPLRLPGNERAVSLALAVAQFTIMSSCLNTS